MDRTDFWRVVELSVQFNAWVTALTGGSWFAYLVGTAVWTPVGIALGFAVGYALVGLLNLLYELRDRLDERRADRHDNPDT